MPIALNITLAPVLLLSLEGLGDLCGVARLLGLVRGSKAWECERANESVVRERGTALKVVASFCEARETLPMSDHRKDAYAASYEIVV